MKFDFEGREYYIDGFLAPQLDSIVYNLKKDWDFIILITGDRTVRVGKSVLGMTVCAYLKSALNKFGINTNYTLNDIYFDNKKMIDEVQKKPKYAINHYDEGREGLATSKTYQQFQQNLMDFYAECGQLNHIWVIVMPDFFEMKEDIAVGRSEFLINVYRKEEKRIVDLYKEGKPRPVVKLMRGYFEFFNRKQKSLLWDIAKAKRQKRYNLIKPAFIGRFTEQYPLDEASYKQLKKDSLSRFQKRKQEQSVARSKSDVIRDKMIWGWFKDGKKAQDIVDLFDKEYGYVITTRYINMIIKKHQDMELQDIEEGLENENLKKVEMEKGRK